MFVWPHAQARGSAPCQFTGFEAVAVDVVTMGRCLGRRIHQFWFQASKDDAPIITFAGGSCTLWRTAHWTAANHSAPRQAAPSRVHSHALRTVSLFCLHCIGPKEFLPQASSIWCVHSPPTSRSIPEYWFGAVVFTAHSLALRQG
jgi:hypothetical protein